MRSTRLPNLETSSVFEVLGHGQIYDIIHVSKYQCIASSFEPAPIQY